MAKGLEGGQRGWEGILKGLGGDCEWIERGL